jgi:hypothetical protein
MSCTNIVGVILDSGKYNVYTSLLFAQRDPEVCMSFNGCTWEDEEK